MSWRESLSPIRMKRVALVAPERSTASMLRRVAAIGEVELDLPYDPSTDSGEFDRAEAAATVSDGIAGFVGWAPERALPDIRVALAPTGAAVVVLERPRGVQVPTLLTGSDRPGVARSLVNTYGTVPYADVDPARLAVVAYVFMFAMMFGDVGHGALLVVIGLVLRTGRIRKLGSLTKTWKFVVAAGAASMGFGALYGEAFGPTGLVPVLWLAPLENPVPLLLAGLLVGAVLVAAAYVIGTVNRVREGGWAYALYARTGIAGSLLFAAVGLLSWGILAGWTGLVVAAAVVAGLALIFIFAGLLTEAGGGPTGVIEAVIELIDTVIRLGSNLVSFARLAAFGLTHAALTMVVWQGTTALWQPDWRAALAVLLFVVGNVITFGLEALVAGIQALRLEYYELFSRIFQTEGRPFRPWAPTWGDTPLAEGDVGPIVAPVVAVTRSAGGAELLPSGTEGNHP